MRVIIHRKVLKRLARAPDFAKAGVLETAKVLEQFPMIHADVKKLGPDRYRIRRGGYRIIFVVEADTIIIYEINVRGRISYSKG